MIFNNFIMIFYHSFHWFHAWAPSAEFIMIFIMIFMILCVPSRFIATLGRQDDGWRPAADCMNFHCCGRLATVTHTHNASRLNSSTKKVNCVGGIAGIEPTQARKAPLRAMAGALGRPAESCQQSPLPCLGFLQWSCRFHYKQL